MKHLLTTLLLLLAISSHALIRKSATPTLHSVLDDKPAAPAFNFMTAPVPDDAAAPPDFRHRYRSTTSSETWRRRGIGFTIAGGTLLLAGAACWIAADAETQRQQANGGRSYTIVYYAGAALIIALGLIFTAIGLPIWLTHLR